MNPSPTSPTPTLRFFAMVILVPVLAAVGAVRVPVVESGKDLVRGLRSGTGNVVETVFAACLPAGEKVS